MKWLFAKITELSDCEYTAIYNALSPSRKNHIDRMKHRDDQLRSLAAQHLLNRLRADFSAGTAVLETGEDGKPFLRGSNLHVSISHSNEGVACAVSETPVGIDIEKVRSVPDRLIDYVCTDAEKAFVLDAPEVIHINFFKVWTAKEAYVKKHGCGIKQALCVDTLSLCKEVFTIEDYIVTVL